MALGKSSRRLVGLLIVVFAVCGGCGPGPYPPKDTDQELNFVFAVSDAKSGDRLDMAVVLAPPWDRFVAIAGGTTDAEAQRLLGFPFPLEEVSPIKRPGQGSTVVLANGSGLGGWFPVFVGDVSLRCLVGRSFLADNSTFVVHDEPGQRFLWQDDVACAATGSPPPPVP